MHQPRTERAHVNILSRLIRAMIATGRNTITLTGIKILADAASTQTVAINNVQALMQSYTITSAVLAVGESLFIEPNPHLARWYQLFFTARRVISNVFLYTLLYSEIEKFLQHFNAAEIMTMPVLPLITVLVLMLALAARMTEAGRIRRQTRMRTLEARLGTLEAAFAPIRHETQQRLEVLQHVAQASMARAASLHARPPEQQQAAEVSVSNERKLREADINDERLHPYFKDPITIEVIEDPVVTPYGHVFSRAALTTWLTRHEKTCPLTRQPLHPDQLQPATDWQTNFDAYIEGKKQEKREQLAQLSTNRHSSQAAQEAYDRTCGMVLASALPDSPLVAAQKWHEQQMTEYMHLCPLD